MTVWRRIAQMYLGYAARKYGKLKSSKNSSPISEAWNRDAQISWNKVYSLMKFEAESIEYRGSLDGITWRVHTSTVTVASCGSGRCGCEDRSKDVEMIPMLHPAAEARMRTKTRPESDFVTCRQVLSSRSEIVNHSSRIRIKRGLYWKPDSIR